MVEPAVALYWYSNVNPTVGPGVPAPLWQLLVRTDSPSIYYKFGVGNTDWQEIGTSGGPAVLGIQSFRYVADGSETTAGFPVVLPVARLDANYNAVVTLGGTAEDFVVQTPVSGYSPTQFTCVPGTNLTVGDVLLVLVVPLT